MKYNIVVILLFTVHLSVCQTIFSHERQIKNIENYISKEIGFYNSIDNIKIFGTLITPKSEYKKIIIIVPGSGKDTRNSHYKLTEEFLKNNIGVYRFDERGVGKSEGKFTKSIDHLSYDLAYAIMHLKSLLKLQEKKIGVLGHSFGGMTSISSYKLINGSSVQIDFLIQIASPVHNFSDVSRHQLKTLSKDQLKNKTVKDHIQLLDTLIYLIELNKNSTVNTISLRNKGIDILRRKGFKLNDIKFWSLMHINLFQHNYEKIYTSLQIPTLYIIGEKDKYVNPTLEVSRLQKIKNPLITIKVMMGLDHYLTQVSQSSEIYNIDTSATKTIMNWIEKI